MYMPTIFHTHDEDSGDHELLHHAFLSHYLEGECYAFAIALHQGLGWPVCGIIVDTTIRHAGVRAPDGRIHDIRGLLTEAEFATHFTLREVSMEELYATRPIDDHSIAHARRLAETLWPELPWISSYVMRVQAFADELEALSRAHGLWIRGDVPASPPLLYTSSGEEGGYRVRPIVDGSSYTITRYFPSEIAREEATDAFRDDAPESI
jgi:hypothetical protein